MMDKASASRDEKIQKLKRNLVLSYGTSLLPATVSPLPPLEQYLVTDTAEMRAEKISKNQRIARMREEQYENYADEMVEELEKLMRRIETVVDLEKKQLKSVRYISNQDMTKPLIKAISKNTFTCRECGNQDMNYFVNEQASGDVICTGKDGTGCGMVVVDHEVQSGAEKRNFEGEEDRNHFGPAPNPLMPDMVNMETSLSTLTGGNEGLKGKRGSDFKKMAQTAKKLEMELSTVFRAEKHTRLGYKVQMKRAAFGKMEEIAQNNNLHSAVVATAKEYFSLYRDEREAMQSFEGIVLACLVLAYEKLSVDAVTYSFTLSRDLGKQSEAKLLAPRSEVKDKPAICTLPDKAMGQFTTDEVKVWLTEIASHCTLPSPASNEDADADGASSAALVRPTCSESEFREVMLQYVQFIWDKKIRAKPKTEDETASSKRKALDQGAVSKIFGSTSLSKRVVGPTTAQGLGLGDEGGKRLVALRFTHTLEEYHQYLSESNVSSRPDPATLFLLPQTLKEAVTARTSYDKLLLEQDERLASEKKRLLIEEGGKMSKDVAGVSAVGISSSSSNASLPKPSAMIPPATPQPSSATATAGEMEFVDMSLEELLGGDIDLPVVALPPQALAPIPSSSSLMSSASSQNDLMAESPVDSSPPTLPALNSTALPPPTKKRKIVIM